MKTGFLYILQSQTNGRHYIGVSENVEVRLAQHNAGLVVATRNKGPWELKFKQKLDSMLEARRLENKLKRFKSRSIIEAIIKDGIIKLTF